MKSFIKKTLMLVCCFSMVITSVGCSRGKEFKSGKWVENKYVNTSMDLIYEIPKGYAEDMSEELKSIITTKNPDSTAKVELFISDKEKNRGVALVAEELSWKYRLLGMNSKQYIKQIKKVATNGMQTGAVYTFSKESYEKEIAGSKYVCMDCKLEGYTEGNGQGTSKDTGELVMVIMSKQYGNYMVSFSVVSREEDKEKAIQEFIDSCATVKSQIPTVPPKEK